MKNFIGLLVEKFGQPYSEILGIDLESGRDEEIFKWFFASVLFGAPISETSVIKTFKTFKAHNVLTPKRIMETGWDGLVGILDEGGYTRYDFKTSDKLLEVMGNLESRYDGSLNTLHSQASDFEDLEKRLKDLGKGIGDITISIFLRELRDLWEKADPNPTPLVVLAARSLGVIRDEEMPREILERLKEIWRQNEIPRKTFVNFETSLLRVGKGFCRKRRCGTCPFMSYCLSYSKSMKTL